MNDEAPASVSKRVLIVEDEKLWHGGMFDLLQAEAKKMPERARITLDIEVATSTKDAASKLAQRFFHVVSMDMRLPGEGGTLKIDQGLSLAQAAHQRAALTSKLVVYSALLSGGDESVSIHAELPKLDRYQKGANDVASTGNALEELTQQGWARRMLAYLDFERRAFTPAPGARARQTCIGCWLEQAQKHLPPVLARHATEMANAWDAPADLPRKVDSGLRFIEATMRLALAQTWLLAGVEGLRTLPGNDSWAAVPEMLDALVHKHAEALQTSTWNWHLKRVLPWYGKARALRNQNRHSLAADASSQTWPQLKQPLQAAMDLASYWAQNPLWRKFAPTPDGGWIGERIAGNQWPRARREFVAPGLVMPREAAHGRGVWQTVVESRGGAQASGPTGYQLVDWSGSLDIDPNERAVWLPLYQRTSLRGGPAERVWMDLDQGGHRSEVLRGGVAGGSQNGRRTR